MTAIAKAVRRAASHEQAIDRLVREGDLRGALAEVTQWIRAEAAATARAKPHKADSMYRHVIAQQIQFAKDLSPINGGK